jgi:glycosyltransferase involved in cell wall biosynthesis
MEQTMLKQPYAITVCRTEPENNVHLVLDAFSRQAAMPLLAVGNWQKTGYGLSLFQKYRDFPHIYLSGPVYDAAEINGLRSNAALYVHGHSAGGTNPSLIEAMFLGLPVFAFDCVFNRYTSEDQCVYWSTADELYSRILCLGDGTIDLDDIGRRMKKIADERYRWNIVVSRYERLYEKKQDGTRNPGTGDGAFFRRKMMRTENIKDTFR